MTTIRQGSFAAGEITPKLHARADLVLYQTGLKTARNAIPTKHSGIDNRPGTVFCDETRYPAKRVKLHPFVFNQTDGQTYVMEYGDSYLEFLQNGGRVVESTKNITNITKANPGVVTSSGHGYANGDDVYITSVVGMTQVNNRRFRVAGVSTDTFQLTDTSGNNVNTSSYTTYASGGTAARIYKISTPYVEADLQSLRIAQSADVVTICHETYAPRDLTRTSHTSWALATVAFTPSVSRPTSCSSTVGVAGSNTTRYKVTAVDDESLIESLSGLSATKNIATISKANPGVVTSTGHGYANGDEIFITGVVGMTEVNGFVFTVANQSANGYELLGTNTSSYTTYTSGGTSALTSIKITAAGTPTSAAPNVLTWTAVSSAREYWVYKESNGTYGYIGAASLTANQTSGTFNDTNITPDTSDTPPDPRNPFSGTGNYPAIVCYYQGRRVFARTTNDPEKIWASKTGDFTNFTTSGPLLDDDAVTFTLTGREVNEIRDLVDVGTSLLALTAGGEWAIRGDGSGVLRPGDTNQKQYSANGASDMPGLVIGPRLLYVHQSGEIINDLGFQFETDSYSGDDISTKSQHLFEGKTISDWAYQKSPGSVVWMVMDDGSVVSLTYVREQQIVAFARHDTDGTVENVCTVPESGETAVYFVVKRTSGGSTKRYIERMATRVVDEDAQEDMIFLDSVLTYDGWNTGSQTMKATAASYAAGASINIVSSASYFSSADIGNGIWLGAASGLIVRCTITAYTSATVVTATPHAAVPADLQSTTTTNWARAVDDLSGLWHLNGSTVGVLGDGFVVANPNRSTLSTVTVASGSITLSRPYAVIHVGLPYLSDGETLNVELSQQGTLIDKQKIVTQMYMYLLKSRGIFLGAKPPSDDDTDPLEGLTRLIDEEATTADAPEDLVTDYQDIPIKGEWNSNGRVFFRQVDPLPMTILSVNPYIPGLRT